MLCLYPDFLYTRGSVGDLHLPLNGLAIDSVLPRVGYREISPQPIAWDMGRGTGQNGSHKTIERRGGPVHEAMI